MAKIKKGHKSRKHKKKHKMCAGPGCRNVVAKGSKKGALCSVCREKLGVQELVEVKEPTPKVKIEEPVQLSVTDRLAALRKKVKGGV